MFCISFAAMLAFGLSLGSQAFDALSKPPM